MLEYHCVDELWNIILCVGDDNLANDAAHFLIDLYYTKQPHGTRRLSPQLLHEYFLKQVHTHLCSLLNSAVPPPAPLTTTIEQYYKSLKTYIEQFITTDHNSSINIDHTLRLQKAERLLMVTEKYIHVVDNQQEEIL